MKIDFRRIAGMAQPYIMEICRRWLPDGYQQSNEWIAINPKREDRSAGSFKVNLSTGKWADFATGDQGSDIIALASYLFDLRQGEAARRVAAMLRPNND